MSAKTTASMLAGVSAGASLPTVFHLLIRRGTDPSTAAAAATALAALAHLPGGPASGSRGLSAGAAGVLLSGLAGLPLIGAKATLAAVPVAVFGPALLLASAASSGWTRLGSLLTGNWSYGQTLTLAALLAGAGPGWRRLAPSPEQAWPPPSGPRPRSWRRTAC